MQNNLFLKFFIVLIFFFFFTNSSFSDIKGRGELKMSERAVSHFIDWVNTNEIYQGRRCKPSMFIISSDGQWTQGNVCCYPECQDTLSKKIIRKCESETRVMCGVFSIRRTIYWDNGINTKKNKAKINTRMTSSDVREKLKQIGFLGDTNTKIKKKVKNNAEISENSEILNQIEKLNDLYKSGVLTKEEFEKAKKKVLN